MLVMTRCPIMPQSVSVSLISVHLTVFLRIIERQQGGMQSRACRNSNPLIGTLRFVVANNPRRCDLRLAVGQPGSAFCESVFRRHVGNILGKIEPVIVYQIDTLGSLESAHQVPTATTTVMIPSTRNSHFQPSRPATPRSLRSPLAMSPLTALAICCTPQNHASRVASSVLL